MCNFVIHDRCLRYLVTPCTGVATSLIKVSWHSCLLAHTILTPRCRCRCRLQKWNFRCTQIYFASGEVLKIIYRLISIQSRQICNDADTVKHLMLRNGKPRSTKIRAVPSIRYYYYYYYYAGATERINLQKYTLMWLQLSHRLTLLRIFENLYRAHYLTGKMRIDSISFSVPVTWTASSRVSGYCTWILPGI